MDSSSEWWIETLKAAFGFDDLLPVQRVVIPWLVRALRSRLHVDVCLAAPTGSGKTLCYLVPVLQLLLDEWNGCQHLRALIIVPTSVLSVQVYGVAKKLFAGTPLRVGCLSTEISDVVVCQTRTFEGVVQTNSTVDILIATPQRVLEQLGHEPALFLGHVRAVVIDEVDKVLFGAFTNLALRIIEVIARTRTKYEPAALHKILCSATLTSHIARISEVQLCNPKYFELDTEGRQAATTECGEMTAAKACHEGDTVTLSNVFALPPSLIEHYVVTENSSRHAAFISVLRHVRSTVCRDSSVLVFCPNPETARVMCHMIRCSGVEALEFTALSSVWERRMLAIEAFSASRSIVVVSTDALMRGIDIPGVGAVVMYNAPHTVQHYIHRAGRTARAGREGHTFCLLSKMGLTGTTEDDEVARFKAFGSRLARAHKPIHEKELQRTITAESIEEADRLLAEAQRSIAASYEAAAFDVSRSRRHTGRKRAPESRLQ